MSPSPFNAPGLRAWSHWARSWLRPTVALYLPAQQPEQAFDAWCRAHPGAPVRLLLAGGLTHQVVVPAPVAPSAWARLRGRSAAAQGLRAAQDWAQHYGPEAHAWPLAAWSGSGLDGSCALHGAQLAALQRSAQPYGVRLCAAVPLWAALLPWADAKQPQWWCAGPAIKLTPGKGVVEGLSGKGVVEALPGQVAAKAPLAALVTVEGTLLTWVQCSSNGVQAVLQRRLAAPTPEALAQKIQTLRLPQQRVLVVGFGLDADAAPVPQPGQSAPGWQTLSPLDTSALPGPLINALASPAGRAARRWPQADLLHGPGSLGLLGRCLVLVAMLGLASSAALWQHNQADYAHAQQQRDAAAASLQSARLSQRSTPLPAAASASGPARTARPLPAGDAQANERTQARKVMAGLRYTWAGVLLPIEATASDQVRWLALDYNTEGGRVRLLGQANNTDAALDAVQTLSADSSWSQVALAKVQAATARDTAGGVRFEITALYNSTPPGPTPSPTPTPAAK